MSDQKDNIITVDATSEIKQNILAYGEEVLLSKFTNNVDGLKAIGRRILWFTKQHTSKTAMGQLIGDLLVVHTSGDAAIYDSIVRLGQPFMIGHPLVRIFGNYGAYYNPNGAAAARYLSACLSDFARDIFYNGINLNTVPMTTGKTANIREPLYFIPKVPMALVLGNLTIGLGFKSTYPLIDFADVCDLVKLYAEFHKDPVNNKLTNSTLAPHLIPKFPIKNLIKNRKELINAYSRGEFDYPIHMEGWFEISGNSVILQALPYGVNFAKNTSAIREAMVKDRKHWLFDYIDSVNDHSDKEARFTFNLKRGKNPFELLEKLKKALHFNYSWSPINSYVKGGRIVTLTPPDLIEYWYHERSDSIRNSLKYKQSEFVFNKMRILATLKIVDHVDEVVDLIRHSDSTEAAVHALHAKFKDLTLYQSELIVNQKLMTLAKCSRKPLEEELEQVNSDLENVDNSFNQVDESISNDASYLKKKYGSTSLTRFADDFIGYVKFGNWGCINFFDLDDMKEILNSKGWPTAIKKSVHLYDHNKPRRFVIVNRRMMPLEETSRQIMCQNILQYSNNERDDLTLVISKDKTVSVVERLVSEAPDGFELYPTGRDFYAVHRNGKITHESYKNFALRKNIATGSKSDVICGFNDKIKNVIIFHMNDKNPNIIRASLAVTNEHIGHLRTVPDGKEFIIGIYPIKTKMGILNIPEECRKSTSMEHLIITDFDKICTDKRDAIININKSTTEFGAQLRRDSEVRTLYRMCFK